MCFQWNPKTLLLSLTLLTNQNIWQSGHFLWACIYYPVIVYFTNICLSVKLLQNSLWPAQIHWLHIHGFSDFHFPKLLRNYIIKQITWFSLIWMCNLSHLMTKSNSPSLKCHHWDNTLSKWFSSLYVILFKQSSSQCGCHGNWCFF